MKRLIFMLSCLTALFARATETTDYISISSLTLTPGGDQGYFIVSLNGSENNYTAYNMDIHLPPGMEVVYNSNNKPNVVMMKNSSAVYPYDEDLFGDKTYYHTLTCSYGVVGERILRVACMSASNAVFTKTSGTLFYVFVKASAYTKPGSADITIDGVALKKVGMPEFNPEPRIDNNVTIGTESSLTVTVSATNQWSTCILPFDADVPEGVKAYTCSDKDEADKVLILTEASTMMAYTPYILYSESGYSGTLSGTVDATKYPAEGYAKSGYLNGAIEVQQVSEGYVLQKLSEGVKFYSCNGTTFSISVGKCWVTLPAGAGSKGFGFRIEETITGISSPQTAQPADNRIFNIYGQQVGANHNGIVISNGKKILK